LKNLATRKPTTTMSSLLIQSLLIKERTNTNQEILGNENAKNLEMEKNEKAPKHLILYYQLEQWLEIIDRIQEDQQNIITITTIKHWYLLSKKAR
jgi:hypothetical protein